MAMKPMKNDLQFVLVFSTKMDEKPYIYGYKNEEMRDQRYAEYEQTGRITLHDRNLDVSEQVEPAYVGRFDMVDGLINSNKVAEEMRNKGLA